MGLRVRIAGLFVAVSVVVFGAAAAPVIQSELAVELHPESHRFEGTQRLVWTNRAGAPTSELWFHLDLNAFAGLHTTLMTELRRTGSVPGGDDPADWGWIRLVSMTTEAGADLLAKGVFERPDDGNPEDHTVLRVPLDHEVRPGAAVVVDMAFEGQLPALVLQTGWAGDFVMAARWYPRLGVFEPAGRRGRPSAGWSCSQTHAAFAGPGNFGRYRVQVTVPESWVFAGNGIVLDEQPVGDGKRRTTFVADRAREVIWCAAPSDQMTVVEAAFEPGRDVPLAWLERTRAALGLGSADLELPPVHLRLLVPTHQRTVADRILRSARLAIAWFGLHYGPYPEPQLTIVAPPPAARAVRGIGGLTLITTGAHTLTAWPPLSRARLIEGRTVHEFGRHFFRGQGLSGDLEDAGLGDGLAMFAELQCLEALVEDRLFPGLTIGGSWWSERLRWWFATRPPRVERPAWTFVDRQWNPPASSTKTALALKSLEGLVGSDRLARALRATVQQWRWRHPTRSEFTRTLGDGLGEDLEWFYRQVFDEDAAVNWGVGRVEQVRRRPESGFRWKDGRWVEAGRSEASSGDPAPWIVGATIRRQGSLVAPVDIAFFFADGREERRTWDGTERSIRYEFSSRAQLTGIVIDPDDIWALEVDRSNNYWQAPVNRGLIRCTGWWITDALRLLAAAVQPWS